MPHIMKRFYFILCTLWLAVCAVVMVSCDTKAVSTPELTGALFLSRTTPAGVTDTIPLQDTLSVGDTLRLNIFMRGVLNPLVSFQAITDTFNLYMWLEIPEGLDQFLIEGSDVCQSKLLFEADKIIATSAVLVFVPRRAGTHSITMSVANSAGQPYSPREYEYKPVVR